MNIFKKIFNKDINENIEMFNQQLVKERVRWYRANSDKIVSNNLRDKFLDSATKRIEEERTYAKNFAKTSLFVDDIIINSKTDITDRHKELITESIFSTYEYLNKNYPNLYEDYDRFFDMLNKKFVSIKFEDVLDGEIFKFGKTQGKDIFLKKSLDNLNEDCDFLFLDLFTHEFSHIISKSKNTLGFVSVEGVLMREERYGWKKTSVLDELQTEYMAIKILEENFGDDILFRFDLNIKKGKETIPIKLESKGFAYREGFHIIETLNSMMDLGKYYLEDDIGLEFLSKKSKPYGKQLENIIDDYIKMIGKENYNTVNQSIDGEEFEKLSTKIENLVLTFCDEEDLNSLEYTQITNSMLKSKIYIENDVSENEISVIKMDFKYYLGEDLKRDEILDIVRDKDHPKHKVMQTLAEERESIENNFIKIDFGKSVEENITVDGFEL